MKWLNKKLEENKTKLQDVFVLIVDESNKIYFQKKESEGK